MQPQRAVARPPHRGLRRGRRAALLAAYGALLLSCDNPLAPSVLHIGHVDVRPASLQLAVGETKGLTAQVVDEAGATVNSQKVYWSSQDPSVVTVDQAGQVTAVGAGIAQVAASTGGVNGFAAITVLERPVTLVRVTPSTGSVVAHDTLRLTAEPLDGNGQVLTGRQTAWSSDDPSTAAVNSDGLVTGVAPGIVTIRAVSESVEGSSVITVLPVAVASLAISPNSASLNAGESLTLQATALDDQGQPLPGRLITWGTDASAVATVSSQGVVTGISPGNATITAASPGNGPGGSTPTATAAITVLLVPVARVEVVPASASLQVGHSTNFTVNLFDASNEPLTTQGRTVTWQSTDPTIASIDAATGVATAVATGSVTLTATVATPGQALSVTGTASLTVSNLPVASVMVTPNPASVHVGLAYSRTFTATTLDGQGNLLVGRSVVWTSSNQSVATVEPSSGVVTGLSPGTVQISAVSEGIQGSASVSVDLVPVSSVSIQPSAVTIAPSATVQLAAVPLDSAGNAIVGSALGGRGTSWQSSDASVASVSSSGLVTGVAQGNATITAMIGGTSGNSAVTVTAVPVASVTVTPSPTSVFLGSSTALTATAYDANGQPLSGRAFSWFSADPTTVSVDNAGNVTGVALGGPVDISATAEGKTGVAQVSVVPRPAAQLAIATQPSASAASGVPLAPQPEIQLEDALGAAVPQMGIVVTASVASGGGTATGSITATTDASGLAVFSGLSITGPAGPYTLSFDSPPLTGVTSGTIVLGAGGPSQLAITTAPSTTAQSGIPLVQQPVVELRDAGNNPVPQSGIVITASVSGAGGTLGGTVTATTDASGVATFTDLGISGPVPGPFTLDFSAAGLTGVSSAPITLSAGLASQLSLTVQPSSNAASGVVFAQQPSIQVLDAAGNPVDSAGIDVTAALIGSGATLGGTLTVTTVAGGVASFTDLSLTGTAGAYTIEFTATGLSPDTSATVTLGAGTATQLAIVTQPSATGTNGVKFPTQPAVQLRDASNNPVNTPNVSVTAAITGGGATLDTTLMVNTDASGVASFTDLTITGSVGKYTLTFASSGLTPIESDTIALAAGAATQLVLTTAPPATANSGEVLSPAPVIQLQDVSGNDVPQPNVFVQVTSAPAGVTLSGQPVPTDNNGTATFSALTLTGTAGDYVLTFSSGSLTPATSGTITLSAGTGSKLSIVQQPSDTTQNGTVFARQPSVQLLDASNNPVPLAGVKITVAIASGGGVLGGTASATTDNTGLATFTSLKITGTAGDRTLIFAASGYVSATSNTVTIIAGPATNLSISTQPFATATSGMAFTTQPVVYVSDVSGNPVAQSGVSVLAAITGGGATLDGTATVSTDVNGVATFTDLGITGLAGSYTLTFSATGLTSAVSNTITLNGSSTPSQLTITTQPSATTTSGTVFAQQPVIQLRDAGGNPVSQSLVSVTAAITGGGATLDGTATVTTNASGVATFTDLGITGLAGSYTLTFSSTGLTSAVSNTITLNVGGATQLTITTQPSANAVSGSAFGQQPVIQLRDAGGNPVPQSLVTVTAAITGGGATLDGTATVTTNASGVATFTDLGITGLAGSYTLTFSSTGLVSAVSNTIALSGSSTPSQLAITTQPSATAVSGSAFGQQPVIQLRDAGGNPVAQSLVSVTAAITGGGATLDGTATVSTNASGVATFTDLGITGLAGSYTLTFSATGLTSAVSNTITLNGSSTPSQLTITTQPSATANSGAVFAQQPVLQLRDAGGNPVAQGLVSVTAAITGGGATLDGTATVTTDGSGVATFTDLGITGLAGSYTLTFSATGLTSAVSNSITLNIGGATQLTITTQPSATATSGTPFIAQPVIQLRDAGGNPVPQSLVSVTAAITGGGATLDGTATVSTNASGVATFTDLGITGLAGSYTLTFSATGLTSAVSNTITLNGSTTPSQLAITTQPSTPLISGSTFSPQPVIQLRDAGGNPVAQSLVSVTAAITGGGATLDGTATVSTDVNGVATFTDLGITGLAGSYTLTFSATGLTSAVSNTITLNGSSTPSQLTITTQPPSSTTSGVVLSPQPVLQLRDAGGNPVAQSGVSVLAAITGGGATLDGTATVSTDVNGVATFTDLGITGLAGSYTLTFSATGLTSAISSSITVNVGPATQLTITTQPSDTATNGAVFARQPVIQLRDAGGNPVGQGGVTITVSITGGGATLNGKLTQNTNGAGVASFTNLGITGLATDYTLTFTATGLNSAVSNTITLVASAATQLLIATEPSSSATSGTPFSVQPVIQLADMSGNAVSQSGVSVTASIATGDPSATLGTTVTVATDASGVATFTDLAITGPSGSYTLQFSSSPLTAVTSTTIVIP